MSENRIPTISIEGRATIVAKADIGFVDLYARADGMLLEDAISESRRKTEKIVDALAVCGSDVKGIVVTDVQVGERKPMLPSSKESPKPEVIKNILVTILPSPATAVRIVDIAGRMGASLQSPGNILGGTMNSAILYGIDDCHAIEESVLRGAIADAQKSAAEAAGLVGKSIGRILEMSKIEMSGAGTRAFGMVRKNKESKFGTDYLSISPEKVELTASLTMMFELLD